MTPLERLLSSYERRLAAYAPSLPADFRQAAGELAATLSPDELRAWAEEGVALAGHSLRSWEAAAEYFRVGPRVLPFISFAAFQEWAAAGRELAAGSSLVATAYYRVSPAVVPCLAESDLREWADLGQDLYKGNWRSVSLATVFFAVSPALLKRLPLADLRGLVRVVETVAERSYELAGACLDAAPGLFSSLEAEDRGPFLEFAAALAETSWADTRPYFEKGHSLIQGVSPDCRGPFLKLSAGVVRAVGRQGYSLFTEGAASLGQVDPEAHGHLITLAEELAVGSPAAAMEFLKSAPDVLQRVRLKDLARWHAAGHRILERTREGGEAYFRLESGKGEEVLEALSSQVELSRVSEVLRLYCKALTGANVLIHPASSLAEKGIGWVSERRPSTEGTAVYLPDIVTEYPEKDQNFAVYKVYATHQAAHMEFGSFFFRFGRRGRVFPRRRHRVEREQRQASRPTGQRGRSRRRRPLTDMERFFDLFADRRLASDLFTAVEDARVDYLVNREYAGIRAAWRRTQVRELARRPDIRALPLRQGLLENLVRASLDGGDALVWAGEVRAVLEAALGVLRAIRQPQATVEDAAEATLLLYDLAIRLPNLSPDSLDALGWEALSEEALDVSLLRDLASPKLAQAGSEMAALPQGQEMPYDSPQDVEFRGDFKPELVQLLMRLRLDEAEAPPGDLSPLSAEQLRELLEKSVEISIGAMAEGDLASTIGLFLSNLEKEAGTPIPDQQVQLEDGQPVVDGGGDEGELSQEVKSFYYDEWDFRAADYKPRWCRVREIPMEEGDGRFYDETLRRHAALASETRRHFELLRPELFRKIKRLYDGEDFELDHVIEHLVEKRAGHGFTDKVYWRRNKVERDIAVAFLLDMSASTDEEIEKRKQRQRDDDFDGDPRRYFQWLAQRRAQAALEPPKRIIDLEKESTALLICALEAIGDTYGIYGFSGYGRDNVEFYVLKDLDESFDDAVERRIDKVTPIRSTRMGPAIRHATAKLEEHDAKVRILFLVSDGRPQDHGYGRDRTEKEYAIHDTHQALMEAKRKGIVPFCLTVDKEGHDYLGEMCEDMGYEVLGHIEALPSRLPTLYRRLTE
jgi:nitric oxide reductase NorD protein